MKQMVKLLLMVSMILGLGLQSTRAGSVVNVTPQAVECLKKAYLAVVEAELSRAENHDAEAAKSYRAAIGFYEKLQADYPGWQAPIVSMRMAECKKVLASLEIPREPEPVTGEGKETAMGGSNAVVRLQDLLSELRGVQSTLELAKTSGDESKVKQLLAEVERLKDELNNDAKASLVLQRKIVKLEAKLSKTGVAGGGTNALCRAVVLAVKSEANRLIKANEVAHAITLLMEAIELMPTEPDLVVLLAEANCRDGRFDVAVKLLAPFDVWKAKNASALVTLGTAYMGLGEIGKARDAMEKALSIKPDSADAHYNLAQILLTISPPDVPGAQEQYQRAIELGAPADLEFENALRTALIITRMKKHSGSEKRSSPRSINAEIKTPGAKTGTP
ncbi:MAG: tetratricopeptide repeat protein [bacterium]